MRLVTAPLAQPGPRGGPLPLATVAVYQLPDTSFVTGTAADSVGTFTLAPISPGGSGAH
jgi:hypothetical protein